MRRRDLSLAEKLESCGAWKGIHAYESSFIAVLLAAIEADTSDYMARLLEMWNDRLPKWRGFKSHYLFNIVFIAIKTNKNDTALLLLDGGIRQTLYWADFDFNRRKYIQRGSILLNLALVHQN